MMRLVVFALLFVGGLAGGAAAQDPQPSAAGTVTKTGKERLSDKAADEQRVDDCKVPEARRTRPRPTACPGDKGD